ncbi:hypothetical protein LQZ18_15020 [Lachnospiraceae bacterium ZAX-1]
MNLLDKYEYKLKLEQIKNLVNEKDYKTAAIIADTINWKKVKNGATLCMVGELYGWIKRYEESQEILLMAYERSPVGRSILYRLTHVEIRLGNLNEAIEYYNEFLEAAPADNMKYILKYEIEKARGSRQEELIEILEEFKDREYTEEWAFELAYLYHRAEMAEKCVEVCDELILWFGEGNYVEKALELKLIYKPLNKLQEDKYRKIQQKRDGMVVIKPSDNLESGEIVQQAMTIPKIISNTGKFNTASLQEELAKSMQQISGATKKGEVADTMDNIKKMVEEIPYLEMPQQYTEDAYTGVQEEMDIALDIDFKEMPADMLDEMLDEEEGFEKPEMVKKQITGQMSIGDILTEWEKTQLAAKEAEEMKKLEEVKAKALKETETLMEQLSDVLPSLELLNSVIESAEALNIEEELEIEDALDIEEGLKIEDALNIEEELKVENGQNIEEGSKLEEGLKFENGSNLEEGLKFEENMKREEDDFPLPVLEPLKPDDEDDIVLPSLEMPHFLKAATKPLPDVREEAIISQVLAGSKEEEVAITKLTEEQKDLFAYFIPITGMEKQLCQALDGASRRKRHNQTSTAGNIVIIGGKGSGTMVLAQDLTKAIQKITKHSGGKVGKISGLAMNQKDIPKMLKQVEGGYLIIEKAGDLSRDTVSRLSSLMEEDTKGLLVILEDTKVGIEKALSRDSKFAKKFTEKIKLPVLTIDELVSFAHAYANKHKYEIDDNMGVLALYNRIGNIQRFDSATTLSEVQEIMDTAMLNAQKSKIRKIFGGTKYNEHGYIILKEKDFDE